MNDCLSEEFEMRKKENAEKILPYLGSYSGDDWITADTPTRLLVAQ